MTDSRLSADREWPHWPNFDQFKHQAKDLLKGYRAGDAKAVAAVQQYEQAPDPAAFALHDAQRVLARSYGFPSWPKLKSYVEMIGGFRQPDPKSDDDANLFLRLACITYFDGDRPSRRMRARQLLAERPHIAKANIYTAAAVGDVAAVTEFLAKNADVRAKGGPFDWEPLLYAAYSRLDSEAEGHLTLQVARRLLEAGADPNAGFLWDWGIEVPCLLTALTGVLGLGEGDAYRGEGPFIQPPHQYWYAFARLLLEAGADPNDSQGLYNRMQYPDDEHLKLLLEFGLGKGQGGPWFERFFRRWPLVNEHAGYLPRTPADILAYQLRWAVGADAFARVKLLVENGADVSGISVREGQEMADYLVARGAKQIARIQSPADEFAEACRRGDADRARELVTSNPSLQEGLEGLFAEATEEGNVDCIRLLVGLGADVNGKPDHTSPLWWAAHFGQLDAVKLLVALGADVHARDPNYNGTALASANYKGQRKVVEYLVQFAPISEAVRFGGLGRVRTLLGENPACVKARDDDGRTPLHYPDFDTQHGEEIIKLLIEHSADVNARDKNGRTPVDQLLRNGRHDLAEVVRRHGGDAG